MSSHMFSELESTCDRVAFLKDGKIIDIVDMSLLRGNEHTKQYKIAFTNTKDFEKFKKTNFSFTKIQEEYLQASVKISKNQLDYFFKILADKEVSFLSYIPLTLENYFLEKYSESERV